MSSQVQRVGLRIGDRVRFSGAAWTVIGLAGPLVRLAGPGGTPTEVTLAELTADPDFERADVRDHGPVPPVSPLDGLPEAAAAEALWWERHIVEVLRGLPPDAQPGAVPRPEYDPELVSLTRREQAKAAELTAAGRPVTASAVKQRRRRYEAGGLAAMADRRAARRTPPHGRADQRVVEAMRQAIDEATDASTRTAPYVFWRAGQILEAEHGAGTVELPSRASLYRLFSALSSGRHVTGLARTRRSLAARPDGPFSRLQVSAPGEVMEIDSTPLDVMVRLDDGVEGRVELTGMVDVATRTVTAAVLQPTARAADASVLLARTVTPEPMRPGWARALAMSASALPHRRLSDIDARLEAAAARPVIIPDTIVVDHGKVFMSRNFRASCAYLGISLQPARKATGTDKPHIERTLGSVASLFAQFVAGYTGRSPEYRGRGTGQRAVWSLGELQELLDEWIIACWQNRPHDGLRDPLHPGRAFTPNEKYAAMVEAAGYVPVALSADDYVRAAAGPLARRQRLRDQGEPADLRRPRAQPVPPAALRRQGAQQPVGGPLRPLRRDPGLGPRPLERRLGHRVLDPAAPGRGPVRRDGLGPRPQPPARRDRGGARRRGRRPAPPGQPGTGRRQPGTRHAQADGPPGPPCRRPHEGRPAAPRLPGSRPGTRARRRAGTGCRPR